MMAIVATEGDETTPDNLTTWQIVAALYSMIHLYTEIKAQDADYRDKLYDNDRKDDDVKLDELKELKTALEYADWAYETSFPALSANCKQAGLVLLRHDTATEPGRVGHARPVPAGRCWGAGVSRKISPAP